MREEVPPCTSVRCPIFFKTGNKEDFASLGFLEEDKVLILRDGYRKLTGQVYLDTRRPFRALPILEISLG